MYSHPCGPWTIQGLYSKPARVRRPFALALLAAASLAAVSLVLAWV